VTLQASAGCVALDYQEMKDMKADELVEAWCDVRHALNQNVTDSIDALSRKRPASDAATSQDQFDQCMGQAKRIERVLGTKGIAQKDLLGKCKAKGK
jgi:hypothetical protein